MQVHNTKKTAEEQPETITHEPTDAAQARATLLKAVADNGADELLRPRPLAEDWTDENRGDGLTSDIAAAIDYHQDLETADELVTMESEVIHEFSN